MGQSPSAFAPDPSSPIAGATFVPVSIESSDSDPGSPRYLNRELGILAFNERVFAMAEDASMPLLERLRYLCIVSSNLDEFFEVRVAWLQQEAWDHPDAKLPDGSGVKPALRQIAERAGALVTRQYQLYNNVLLPALEAEGIDVLQRREAWSDAQVAWLHDYFKREVEPVLTPIGLDPAHPFPQVLNKSLNFIVELEGEDAFGRDMGVAIVQAPRVLPRVIQVPPDIASVAHGFITLAAIIGRFVDELFPGMRVQSCSEFRVTRNSELFVDEEEIEDLRAALQGELLDRHFGSAVRLEVSASCPPPLAQFLTRQFELDEIDLYSVEGPVNLVRLSQIPDLVERPDLKFAPVVPGLFAAERADLFAAIAAGDILLHHPYQSFQPVLDFARAAANDPAVVAIKQTIYRTGAQSALMETLIQAARNGKAVTVVVELMARFDEEANINWAARLEEVGAHVVYGVVGHKTHAKMLMVVRREEGRLRPYVHLATGNYHPRTARLYTDFGLFSADPTICNDVREVFRQLTGPGKTSELAALLQSPFTLHEHILAAIRRESEHARAGKRAHIMAKMNALLEPAVIDALYDASCSGVQIDLIVRGVCALRPGVAGLSENIRVRSIVGRFLEHHRVFYFLNDGREDVYLSSADWMGRNFFGRVEVCFPVNDPHLKARVIEEGLHLYLEDTEGAWCMRADGEYDPPSARRGAGKSAQRTLLERFGQTVSR